MAVLTPERPGCVKKNFDAIVVESKSLYVATEIAARDVRDACLGSSSSQPILGERAKTKPPGWEDPVEVGARGPPSLCRLLVAPHRAPGERRAPATSRRSFSRAQAFRAAEKTDDGGARLCRAKSPAGCLPGSGREMQARPNQCSCLSANYLCGRSAQDLAGLCLYDANFLHYFRVTTFPPRNRRLPSSRSFSSLRFAPVNCIVQTFYYFSCFSLVLPLFSGFLHYVRWNPFAPCTQWQFHYYLTTQVLKTIM